MKNVNENKDTEVKMIKHFIKDLSFENPQDVNQNNPNFNNNNDIVVNMNVIYEPYNRNSFGLILKYTYDCSSKESKQTLCHLELDYFGFFKILIENFDQKTITQHGLKLIFPYAKEIIEDITLKGGSIPISLKDIDFNLIEI